MAKCKHNVFQGTRDKLMREILEELAEKKVLIIGDAMLDHYLVGDVERISPEAPVPVVCVEKEEFRLGGAGNVAKNVAKLGGRPTLFSVLGDDAQGQELSALCRKNEFETSFIVDETRPTTRKSRIMARQQQVVRVDWEVSKRLTDRIYDRLFEAFESHVESDSVIIVSDYGKGMVSQAFMDRLNSIMKGHDHKPTVLVDPKVRNYPLYNGVDLLTPNAKEASECANIRVDDKKSVLEAGRKIMNQLESKHLLITLGSKGMALFKSKDEVYHIPTVAQKVFDVTGAGDTVIATLALALAANADVLKACTLANLAAGIVVARVGAATATKEEMLVALGDLQPAIITQWT